MDFGRVLYFLTLFSSKSDQRTSCSQIWFLNLYNKIPFNYSEGSFVLRYSLLKGCRTIKKVGCNHKELS